MIVILVLHKQMFCMLILSMGVFTVMRTLIKEHV